MDDSYTARVDWFIYDASWFGCVLSNARQINNMDNPAHEMESRVIDISFTQVTRFIISVGLFYVSCTHLFALNLLRINH